MSGILGSCGCLPLCFGSPLLLGLMMKKAIVRATLLAFILPLILHADHFLRNDLLNLKAAKLVNEMGDELEAKTGIHAYVIATNEHFPERFNLVTYTQHYEANMTKPYVVLIFAPFATITEKSGERGRIGIIPSSGQVRAMYDHGDVVDAGVDIVAMKDSNKFEDKVNIGVVQAYSELADEIAASKGVKLTKTIPNEMKPMITVLKVLIYTGSLILLWIFILRPLFMRMKHGRQ
jgi:hypothetical protein